jgi:hypothetical protein
MEKVDPLNYARRLLFDPHIGIRSKHLFLAYGLDDQVTPNVTTGFLAAALKVQLAEPVVENLDSVASVVRPVKENRAGGDGSLRTAACFQYEEGGHWAIFENPNARNDWLAFIGTLFNDGVPTVD